MMIHEKIMSGQFLLDFKTDHSAILHAHHQHQLHHQQPSPPTPPMNASQLDIYSAYAYQQQQQQQQKQLMQQKLIGSHQHHFQQHQYQQASTNYGNATSAAEEVLDLSRRCDSVETPRKTPSPYQTNSSYGSPAGSPTSNQQQQQHKLATQLLSNNLLYSVQAQPQASLGLVPLYPALYYPNIKQEAVSPPPQATTPQRSVAADPAAAVAATNLLQSLASVAAASVASPLTAMQVDAVTPHSPKCLSKSPNVVSTTTSSTLSMASPPTCLSTTLAQDSKTTTTTTATTRPFKAFPRDPLVIAANFAATDVLLDNPRVERYTEYRKRVLEQIRSSNGGSRTITNPKMRRTNSRNGNIHEGFSSSNHNSESDERNAAEESSDCDSNAGNFDKLSSNGANTSITDANGNSGSGNQLKDAAYYERRRKNNAAAKKSRDRRRIKEDEIAIRAAYLERQNIELLCQIDALKAQIASYASKVGA